MTERMDTSMREPAGNADTSAELDLTTLPWLVPDEPDSGPEEAGIAASPARPSPPPRPARAAGGPESTTILGGAVARAAATGLAQPRRLVMTPKPRPAVATAPLPSVIIPNATLPPRARDDDEPRNLAEPIADDDVSDGRSRPTQLLIAVGAVALAALAIAGIVRLRGHDESAGVPAVYSPPAFVTESGPSAPTPSPLTPSTPAEAATPLAPVGAVVEVVSTEVPASDTIAAPTPPLAPAGLLEQGTFLPPTPVPASPRAGETPPAPAPVAARAPAAAALVPSTDDGERAVGTKTAPGREASSVTTPPTKTPDAPPPRSRHGGRHELAAPRPSPSAPPRAPATSAAVDPITTYTFGTDELFRVQTAPKRVTDLILQPGEKLATRPSAGDASLWIIHVIDAVHGDEPQQHVQVTPLRAETTTNLTLTTDRRNYHLELVSSGSGTYMAAVEWRYPEHDAERRRRELERLTRERQSTTRVVDAKALRFDYSIRSTSGEPPWRPTMVFDDGAQTFIRFPGGVSPDPLPLLFVVRTGGTKHAEYVNYRVRGDLYVVDRVVDAVELRVPSKDGAEPQQVVLIQRSSH